MKKNLILLSLALLFYVYSNASINNVNNSSDSVFVFTYANGPATDGIKMAYSNDCHTWIPIGNGRSFVKSDYGNWGGNKKMYDPSIIYDNGEWYAVWAVNNETNQFATTKTKDFWIWKPQDYPYLSNNQNFLHPLLVKENTVFCIYYTTNDGNTYKISSTDFKEWTQPDAITKGVYERKYNKVDVILHGNKIKGEIHRVPFAFVQELIRKSNDAIRRENLNNESTNSDGQRFNGVKGIKATLDISKDTKKISENLIGIFFEDINYSADGGLYAELIQNRDFEYNALDRGEWNSQSFWELKGEGAEWKVLTDTPIHENNKHYIQLTSNGSNASIVNNGFDGIVVRKGDKYDLSLFARALDKSKQSFVVKLLDGENVIASKSFSVSGNCWKQFNHVLVPSISSDNASLEIEIKGKAVIQLDFISLFPQKTFKNRPNGLRADLAQTLADLKPSFIRFPGGCVSHGNGLKNMYRWRETVGPLWERKSQSNIWGYHQSKGLGFHEYFQFCEDIGAEPLPVLPAGVCCQNSSRDGFGQQGGLPWSEMESYAQELLDLIEWANGDASKSKLAKIRADAGHPAPFNLKMIGVGNEDLISDVFVERFNYLNRRIKENYPDIQVVGTVGPFFEGSDYEYGWKLAREENIDIVDEHYYVGPGWYVNNQFYYDKYNREGTKVYLGEWASRSNHIENALAEALHITNLERNADVVIMSSYAPLLAKHGHTQWNPDLIYFNNTDVFPTVNYYVQKLCGNNVGSKYVFSNTQVKTLVEGRDGNIVERDNEAAYLRVRSSVVIDDHTGDMIIKLVNMTSIPTTMAINIDGKENYNLNTIADVICGEPGDKDLAPRQININLNDGSTCDLPPYSFTVIRLKPVK